MTRFTNIGNKDEYGHQVRIEHRGKYTRVSRTGGVSIRAQAKAAGVNVTANSQHGVRVSTRVAKGTQVAFQNGQFRLRGRYGKGPHKLNLSKSGMSISSKNALGTFNWFKPNRSSAKVFGIQVRGKTAANLQLFFMVFQAIFLSIQVLFQITVRLAQLVIYLISLLLQIMTIAFKQTFNACKWLRAHLIDHIEKRQEKKLDNEIARRVEDSPESWHKHISIFTTKEQVASLAWMILMWGKGETNPSMVETLAPPSIRLSNRIDSALLKQVGADLNALTASFETGHELRDELALFDFVCQQLVNKNSEKLVEDLLRLDERVTRDGKTRLQERMIGIGLARTNARFQSINI